MLEQAYEVTTSSSIVTTSSLLDTAEISCFGLCEHEVEGGTVAAADVRHVAFYIYCWYQTRPGKGVRGNAIATIDFSLLQTTMPIRIAAWYILFLPCVYFIWQFGIKCLCS